MSSGHYMGLIGQKQGEIASCEKEISALSNKIQLQEQNKANYISKSDNYVDDVQLIKGKSNQVSALEDKVKLSKEYAQFMGETYWNASWSNSKSECATIENEMQDIINRNKDKLNELQNNLNSMNTSLENLWGDYNNAVASEQAAQAAAEEQARAAAQAAATNSNRGRNR